MKNQLKITDLEIRYQRNNIITDEFGNRVRNPNWYLRERPVNCADYTLRGINFIIDTCIVGGVIWALLTLVDSLKINFSINEDFALIIGYIFFFCFFLIYYGFMEFKFQRTIGKFITGTIVIDAYCGKPSVKQIILRTFYRYLTFFVQWYYFNDYMESKTGFRGMHDRSTNTWTVSVSEYEELKFLLAQKTYP